MTTYFKFLSKSSNFFLEQARLEHNKDQSRYYILSSMIQSWILLESYINYVSEALSGAKGLDLLERSILLDKEIKLNDDGELREVNSHIPVLKRTLFVIRNFTKINVKKFRQTKIWHDIKNAENLRNEIIHTRTFNLDLLTVKRAENTRDSVIAFIKKLNKSIFNKSLNLS